MEVAIVLLSGALALSLFLNFNVFRLYNRLKYICLTNAKMSFLMADNEFRIKVHSEQPWTAGIGHVYSVFSSPGVYANKLAILDNREDDSPSVDVDWTYKPGSWKEAK